MDTRYMMVCLCLAVTVLLGATSVEAAKPKYATDIPANITTPDKVETRLGTLRFFDGMPDEKTVGLAYDNLDFQRGVSAFINAIPIASMYAMREGIREGGVSANHEVGIMENLLDSKPLFLTGNSTTYYVINWIDLKDGPVVAEIPPGVLGFLNDAAFHYVCDMGNAGPDKGKGGKFLFVPPGYKGELPKTGYFVVNSPTFGNWFLLRAFPGKDDPQEGVKNVKKNLKIYSLSDAANPPEMKFVNWSGKHFNTIHANDFGFYEEVNAVIQEEPSAAFDPEILGLLAAIGIQKGKPFNPDRRMKELLTDAAAVGNATARSILFGTRDSSMYYYPDRQWKICFNGGYRFIKENGERWSDARALFHYYATGCTPAMEMKIIGGGSQYVYTERDAEKRFLDGGKTYKITVPPKVPMNNFWSFMVYDSQTRSMLQTDTPFPGIDSKKEGMKKNDDGSYTIYFGPEAPEGKENNWVQTLPGKSFNVMYRMYGPLEPWFEKTWKLNDFELVSEGKFDKQSGQRMKPKQATDIPKKITTPDQMRTRIGTLNFFDGIPTDETIQLAYDNLDFRRGTDAFLNNIQIASMSAIRKGMREAGVTRHNIVGIYENLMDSQSLFLTANTTVNYVWGWLDLKDGPIVVESPPGVLGLVDDFTFKYVADIGKAGPDKGKGGKFLFLPPDFEGEVPKGYFTFESPTYGNWLALRAFPTVEDPQAGVKTVKANLKIYRLSEAKNPPTMTFLNWSGKPVNTIHGNDFSFYEEVNTVVQEEPTAAFSAEDIGLLASIGIQKGKPFEPDTRMKEILVEAVAVGNATARAITYATRYKEMFYYPDRQWKITFNGGYKFLKENGERHLDGRTLFHYMATGNTPAMEAVVIGGGSQYVISERDSKGRYLDGGHNYRITVPPNVPAKDFWSFMVYSGQHRSMLQTDQQFPGIDSKKKGLQKNGDGSVTVYFGPKAPEGKESNWVQTLPRKSFNVMFRMYGPLEPWFDKTWKLGDFERMK
jgi:hypothetical protein